MIINGTNGKMISQRELICTTVFSQTCGLMFRKKQTLLMAFKRERVVSLHNFFVFYPLDVLVLDKNNVIVEIKRNFRPFTFWKSGKKGKGVIEVAFPQEGMYSLGDIVEIR